MKGGHDFCASEIIHTPSSLVSKYGVYGIYRYTGTVPAAPNSSGTITVEVNGQYYDEAAKAYVSDSKAYIVDTYYGCKYVDIDNDGKPEWVVDKHPDTTEGTVTSNDLYQVPVIKVDGLNYGTYPLD